MMSMRPAFEKALRDAEDAGRPLRGAIGIVYRALRKTKKKRRRKKA